MECDSTSVIPSLRRDDLAKTIKLLQVREVPTSVFEKSLSSLSVIQHAEHWIELNCSSSTNLDLGHPAAEAGIFGSLKAESLAEYQIPATPAFKLWYACCAGMT